MTPLEACQAELVEANTPSPDFLGEDLTPAPILLWMFEASKIAMQAVTAAAAALEVDPDEPQPVMSDVLNGVSMALGGYMYALVRLEVFPPEALEAVKNAGH